MVDVYSTLDYELVALPLATIEDRSGSCGAHLYSGYERRAGGALVSVG